MSRLEPGARIADRVYDAIHAAIIDGELSGGDRLRIRELADELGTSTMPVREAIRRLEEAGLAEALPYKGAVVKSFSNAELLELYSVRTVLEVEAARAGALAARVGDASALRRAMREEMAAMEASVGEGDAVRYLANDEAFLLAIYRAAGNATLVEFIQTLWARCRTYKLFGAQEALASNMTDSLLRYQSALEAAVLAGDADRAGSVTRESLDAATARISSALDDSKA